MRFSTQDYDLIVHVCSQISADEKLDFLSQHLTRGRGCAAKTEQLAKSIITSMSSALPHRVPLHFQEPFRRDYSPTWQPLAADFYEGMH